ncbi:ABC transporter substrate-binding protein [Psychromonas aquatilis]|uniref:ABC transporter substrate-binding protein n=1 Tax=Psychromonas aquatilis TaxID=2005072 RepID=A0ABU9GS89_9GAMM
MNAFKLIFFALFLLLLIAFIQFKKDIFVLFEEGTGNFTTQISTGDFPKTLTDVTGITYTLTQPPKRIISATLATDHILSALVSQERIVGVSRYVDYPSLSNIVDFYAPSIRRTKTEIESILSLQPDLVFVASYSDPEAVRYLLRSDIAVVRLSEFKSFTDIINNIRLIADITDSKVKGQQVIDELENRIEFIKAQVKPYKKPRVLYYDLNGFSVGGNSLMNEAINISGGINVAENILPDGEHKISEELAISLQPDIIVMSQWIFNDNQQQQSPVDILKNKVAWANVPAIKNNKVYAVPGTWLRTVSQFRIKGVEAIAAMLHPEIKPYPRADQANQHNSSHEVIDVQ